MESESDRIEILLTYNETEFVTFVSPAFYEVLNNNPDALEDFAQIVYEKEIGKATNPIETDNPTASTSNSNNYRSEKFIWTHQATKLLVDTRLDMEKDFAKPICSKMRLWKKVADKLLTFSYRVTGEACHNKYRSLLHTYRVNKKKQKSSGEETISWEYFDKFDSVLGNKESTFPSQVNLGISLDENIPESIGERNIDLAIPEETEPPRHSILKKKTGVLSLGRYLYLKNEHREKKWKETVELKKEEINAIKELAAAIRMTK